MTTVDLYGCRPEPLGSYLAALGVLRLVAEQADAGASGWWEGGRFVVRSALDEDGLREFFLDRYAPTPIVSPWNKSSGFGSEGRDGLAVIAASDEARLRRYGEAIHVARQILDEVPSELAKDDRARKAWIHAECRSRLPDEAVRWLDAAIVVLPDGQMTFPPLLGGTGGNLGRFELSRNFQVRVVEALGLGKNGAVDRQRWLEAVLFGTPAPLVGNSPGMFQPGQQAEELVNPWEFVLLIEGSLLFAAGAARRLGASVGGMAAPFAVRPTVGDYPGPTDQPGNVKGEVWTPLWSRPAGYGEVRRLFAEGRARWRGQTARRGVDMAKAAASLGVDRGIDAFGRHVLAQRYGQALVAVPAGRVVVTGRPEVAPLAALDAWLEQVRRAADLGTAPRALIEGIRRIETAELTVARGGGAGALADVLLAAARLEAAVAGTGELRDKYRLRPVSGLPADRWADALLGAGGWPGALPELRLALSLASGHDRSPRRGGGEAGSTSKVPDLRSALSPVERDESGRWVWSPQVPVPGLGLRPLAGVLADAHARRALTRRIEERREPLGRLQRPYIGVPTRFELGWSAELADVALLTAGRLDDQLLTDLLRGCLLLDFAGVRAPDRTGGVAVRHCPPALAALGPFYCAQPWHCGNPAPGTGPGETDEAQDVLPTLVLEPEPSWPALLAAGRPDPVAAALRRLRLAGVDVLPLDGRAVGAGLRADGATRLGAALLCRLGLGARHTLVSQLAPATDVREAGGGPRRSDRSDPTEEETGHAGP